MDKIIIIIPAFNVERTIGRLLAELQTYKENSIVIDDGSVDNTFGIVKNLGYKVIRQEENHGVSHAVRKGLDYALENNYEGAVFMDADGQHSPKYIPQFISLLNKYDFVTANRFHETMGAPDIKICSNLLASMLVKRISGYKCNDVACGYKAIRINSDLRVYLSKSTSYSVVYDLLYFALSQRYSITTINIEPIYNLEQLLFTKRAELISLLESTERFCENTIMMQTGMIGFMKKVKDCMDFQFIVEEVCYYGFYISSYDGYIIQADKKQLKKYIKSSNGILN